LQIFWVADQLVRPEPYIPPDYLGMAALYAVAWCAAMVTLAAFLFERRDIV
jgi:ABC-type transport system involved in multi-copper enzyme maturation permease subunit